VKTVLLVGMLAIVAGCSGDGLLSPEVLSYRATSRVVDEPVPFRTTTQKVIETSVTITNTTRRTLTFAANTNCIAGIRAFRTPDLSASPAYTYERQSYECAAVGYLPSSLAPGESREVTLAVLVSTVLDAAKSDGTYYLEAVFIVGGGDIESGDVHVPAGAVELTR
jgi:hypothetical protein